MFLCNSVALTQLVKATVAVESTVRVTAQWLASVKPSSGQLYNVAEELKSQVKKMGGFFQLLIQVNTEHVPLSLVCSICAELMLTDTGNLYHPHPPSGM